MKYFNKLLPNLDNSTKRAKSVLYSSRKTSKLNDKEIVYWPLFFSDDTVPFENEVIDTCGISVGLIAFMDLMKGNIGYDEQIIISKTVYAILCMRNKNGSWPSFVYASKQNKIYLEGIINDTTFALNALVKTGFLTEKPNIDKNTLNSLKLSTISKRINYFFESISWLKTNRINKAWYYTGIENFTNTEGVLSRTSPTISVINTLSSIHENLKVFPEIKQSVILEIELLLDEAIEELLVAQSQRGGFSGYRGDIESIAHTCNAISCLLNYYDNNRYEQNIIIAIKWLLKKNIITKPDKIKNSDYFDEYAQILSSDSVSFKKRNIHHENFIDAQIYYTLQCVINSPYLKKINFYEKYMLSHFNNKSFNNLLSRQLTTGNYSGAFQSRRHVPSEEYPIYAIQQSVLGLLLATNNIEKLTKIASLKWKFLLFLFLIIVFGTSFIIFTTLSTIDIQNSLLFSFLFAVITGLSATLIIEISKKFFSTKT